MPFTANFNEHRAYGAYTRQKDSCPFSHFVHSDAIWPYSGPNNEKKNFKYDLTVKGRKNGGASFLCFS